MKLAVSRWWVRVLTLVVLATGNFVLIAATLDDQQESIVRTISSWDNLRNQYLLYRDSTYKMLPPLTDMTAETFQTTGTAIQNDPNWYWIFNGGDIYCDNIGDFAKLYKKLPLELIIYEDLENNEVVIESIGTPAKELYSAIAPVWQEQTYQQTVDGYTAKELGKRRVVWQVTLNPIEDLPSSILDSEASILPIPIMLMGGGASITNIRFTAISKLTNGTIETGISYPIGFTNRLDIFTVDSGTGLLTFWWDLAVNATNVNTSTNYITWIDTDANNAVGGIRFYAAANADTNSTGVDADSDGLSTGRERFLYHTSPTNSDSDGDGLNDYEEVINLNTDPNNDNTNTPTISLDSPINDTERITLP